MRRRTSPHLRKVRSSRSTPGNGTTLAGGFCGKRGKDILRKQRNRVETNLERVFHGVHDGGGWTVHRKLADTLGTKRSVNIARVLEEHADGRQVRGSGHDVVCHLAV